MAQSLDATFYAFRKREKSGVLLSATLAYLGVAILLGVVFWFLNRQGFADYFTWAMNMGAMGAEKPGVAPSFEAMMPPPSVMAIIPAYTLFLFAYYILFAAYEAACLRWMVRGETGGLLGLSLGADTWRVYFTYWTWFLLLMAVYIVGVIVVIGLGVATGVSANASDPSAMGAMAGVIALTIFALLFVLVFLAVRFAPAAATSIARRRFAFFDAWAVTSGRFWSLLGAFVLLFLMYFVASIVISSVGGAMIGMNAMSVFGANPDPNMDPSQALAGLMTPQVLAPLAAMYLIIGVAAMLWVIAMFGVNARAVQAALEEGKITPAPAQ